MRQGYSPAQACAESIEACQSLQRIASTKQKSPPWETDIEFPDMIVGKYRDGSRRPVALVKRIKPSPRETDIELLRSNSIEMGVLDRLTFQVNYVGLEFGNYLV
ncbi:MAG: hypothetical protein H8E18_13070 [FCB group bacterium]|nr:hypothetical protein [FCB group bacterium]